MLEDVATTPLEYVFGPYSDGWGYGCRIFTPFVSGPSNWTAADHREYRALPEVKAKHQAYRKTDEYRARNRERMRRRAGK